MMADVFAQAIAHVVTALKEAGVKATNDPAKVQLPGAIVYPSSVEWPRLGEGVWNVSLDLVFVAGDLGAMSALAQLETMLSAARTALDLTDATAVTIALPTQGPAGLPGFTSTVTLEVTTEEG